MFAGFDGHGRGFRDAFEYLAGSLERLIVADDLVLVVRRKSIEIPQRAEHVIKDGDGAACNQSFRTC